MNRFTFALILSLLVALPAWSPAPRNPLLPTNLGQFEVDGVTPILQGAAATGTTVILSATLHTTDAQAQLCIEVKPSVLPFSNVATSTSALVFANTVVSIPFNLGPGSWKWQAWVFCTCGSHGPKAAFGTGDPDFVISSVNTSPNPPAALSQHLGDGTTPLPAGAPIYDGMVVVKSPITDPDNASLRLQVEAKPLGTPFTNTVTAESIYVPSGATATVQLTGLAHGAWHWQARTMDWLGIPSSWVAFGGNPESDADFVSTSTLAIPKPAPSRHTCGGAAGGTVTFPVLAGGFGLLSLLALLLIPSERRSS